MVFHSNLLKLMMKQTKIYHGTTHYSNIMHVQMYVAGKTINNISGSTARLTANQSP